MILRIIFLHIIFFTFSIASFQEVRIGKIDSYYQGKINEKQLRDIINEIEYIFETQLDFNVFDYSSKNGKDIDIVYVEPSRLEKRILKKHAALKTKQKQMEKLQAGFPEEQEKVDILKSELEYENTIVNNKVKEFNDYVLEINKKGTFTKAEYKKVQADVKAKKKILDKEINTLKKTQRTTQRKINSFNQKINSFNNLIRSHNRINNEIEIMGRSFKKVKGMTFGMQEIEVKTFYKDGKKVKEKSVRHSMDKIEIYGFENLNELKTTLAHEIGHLVGIPHININRALMNPTLQRNQIENLSLTEDDIRNFKENF